MSYARFGHDGSDVYVFTTTVTNEPHVEALDCCGCQLDEGVLLKEPWVDVLGITHTHIYKGFKGYTSGQMIEHLKEHRKAGHHVPQETIDDILADYPDLNKTITEYETQNDIKENK